METKNKVKIIHMNGITAEDKAELEAKLTPAMEIYRKAVSAKKAEKARDTNER